MTTHLKSSCKSLQYWRASFHAAALISSPSRHTENRGSCQDRDTVCSGPCLASGALQPPPATGHTHALGPTLAEALLTDVLPCQLTWVMTSPSPSQPGQETKPNPVPVHTRPSHIETLAKLNHVLCIFGAPQKGQKTGRDDPFLSDVSIAEARLPPCSVTAWGSAELLRQAILPEKLR